MTFKKKSYKKELNIEGNKFNVDFGRDDIGIVVKSLEIKCASIESKYAEYTDFEETQKKVIEEQKEAYREAINAILEDDTASEKLFADDDTMAFMADVYLYIVHEYAEAMSR